jgi:iron complex transport system substrate-binding protein
MCPMVLIVGDNAGSPDYSKLVAIFNEVLGKDVEAPERPARIISLSPSITETLYMLGMGDRIIGVSAFCARPQEARLKRKVGSYGSTNVDLLKEMKPDLILVVTGYQRDLAVKLAAEFPVYPIALPVSVAGIVDLVVKVGLVVGEPDWVREISSQLLRDAANTKPCGRRLRTYVEIDLGGPATFGAYSYITDALRFLGAAPLFGEVRSEWLKPKLDAVAALDPEVIFYEGKMYSKFNSTDLERLIDKRGWRGLTAVSSNHYFLTQGPIDFIAHHGPSFITQAMPWLSQKLAESC